MAEEKITISALEEILAQRVERREVDRNTAVSILEDAKQRAASAGYTPQVREETRDITLLIAEQEVLDRIDTERLSAFTVQIESGADHNTLVQHLVSSARNFNAEAKRASSKIWRLGEVFDTLKPKKHLDGFPKRIYTKESALVIKTTNLPLPGGTPADG